MKKNLVKVLALGLTLSTMFTSTAFAAKWTDTDTSTQDWKNFPSHWRVHGWIDWAKLYPANTMSPCGFIDANGQVLYYDSYPQEGERAIDSGVVANVDSQYPIIIEYNISSNRPVSYIESESKPKYMAGGGDHIDFEVTGTNDKLTIFREATRKLGTLIPYEYGFLNNFLTRPNYTPAVTSNQKIRMNVLYGAGDPGIYGASMMSYIPADYFMSAPAGNESPYDLKPEAVYGGNGLHTFQVRTVMYDPTINVYFDQDTKPLVDAVGFTNDNYQTDITSKKYGPRGCAYVCWDPDTNNFWYANPSLYRATADERFLGSTLDEYNAAAIGAAQKLGCRWKYDLCLVDARYNYDSTVPAAERIYRTSADAIAAKPNDFNNF